ncbi:peptidase S41 [Acidobacteria bacterium Mor1]|nr:peptidase S41 [Acidobacteria bacterium Mor1]
MRRGLICLLLCLFAVSAAAQTKLLRFPDVHGDQVVFTYAGDLWLASTSGGSATRLTTHDGVEQFARFSPDGNWIAFTGQYDGDEQVYVIPTRGGAPRQLTFYPAFGPLPPRWGSDNQVYGWSPDGKSVLFRSMRGGFDLTDTQLYTVPVDGGLPVALPMPTSGAGEFSPDGKQVVYSPLVRDFRTWKRYEGGWAQNLFIFDLKKNTATQITDDKRTERDPMWIGDAIYFASDRDGTLNLYRYATGSGEVSQITRSKKWDVRWPSSDNKGQIVYEEGGELRLLDVSAGSARPRPISIFVPDDGINRRPSRIDVSRSIADFSLSPKGERALFTARGDIFTAPIENGRSRNLTRSSGAHDKGPVWSPDGSRIAFISDRTGEEEIWLIAQDGSGEPTQLTRGGNAMRYTPAWAPDGKRLAFSDKDGKIYVVEVDGKKMMEVADEERGQVQDYVWSPNGGHLAFTLSDLNGFNAIWVWSVESGKTRRVTGELFNEYNPAWGPKGDYLFYLSDRQFQPQIGSIEWNYVVDRETGIYAVALRDDVEHPLPPRNDEVTIDKKDDDSGDAEPVDEDADKEKQAEEEAYIEIDFDGIADRVARMPVSDDNLTGLAAGDGLLFFVRTSPFYYGRGSDRPPALQVFSFKDRKVTTLADPMGGYDLSMDRKKVLVREGGGFKLYDAGPKGEGKAVRPELGVDRVPAEEWAQIFDEVWRRFRDFFYVENMHGYDWDALRGQYRPLLEHVAHRSDLNYVIGEMIAELNVSHAYISGGDYDIPERPSAALLGAAIELDRKSGRYRFSHVHRGHNEEPRYRSPLTEIGVGVGAGHYLLAIEGQELGAGDNPYEMLRHRGGEGLELTVNDKPTLEGSRKVRIDPISGERSLRYLEWVTANREKVSEATGGRVGYLHIPDMGANGIREFIKYYYGQVRKEGLVVDVRGNGGGNVSQMIIERLGRDLLGTRFIRTSETPGTYPNTVFHGHMVCILDEDSASDGDIFPYRFRQAGLGPLIGKRSWGGVIGITNRGTLIDGGTVNVPEFGTNAPDGSWIIEGTGVEPDIEVDNPPSAVLAGKDPQLERAIEEVLAAMKREPRTMPDRPADPVRTR